MSKRAELRQRRQQRARRKQGRRKQAAVIGATLVLAFAVVGFAIYQSSRPIGEYVRIEKETLPYADGKALGAADAPVAVQEFSDFQ